MKDPVYSDYYSQYYLKEKKFEETHYTKEEIRLSRLLDGQLPPDKDSRMFEIGCGVGFLLNYLKRTGYVNVQGIDLSEEALALCRQYVTKNVVRVNAIDYLRMIKDQNEHYDAVFAFDTLEHFNKNELIELFELIYKILNKDGCFYVKVGNMGHILGHQLYYHDFTHLTGFTDSSLKHLFLRAGFSGIKFINQPVSTFRSKIKSKLEHWLHALVYWACRVEQPVSFNRKLVCIGKKTEKE